MFNLVNANLKETSLGGDLKKLIAFRTSQNVATQEKVDGISFTKPNNGMKREETAVDNIQMNMTLLSCSMNRSLLRKGSLLDHSLFQNPRGEARNEELAR